MPALPDDIEDEINRFSSEEMARCQVIDLLIGMVTALKARNQALLNHIGGHIIHGIEDNAVVVTVGSDAATMSILTWRGADERIRQVVL